MKPLSGNKYRVIGAMSGTSLDGLDLAAVEFQLTNGSWKFTLLQAATIEYPSYWHNKLKYAHQLSGEELLKLHVEYGIWTGRMIRRFIDENNFKPQFIGSHGHTIFHQPENGFTFQLGNGFSIAAETGVTTVADFRSGDVALGGQGAPLVPAGDRLLFSEYMYCLNLGGFANVSFEENNRRIAFDICPVNFVLNRFAEKKGLPFDKDGEFGKKGKVQKDLLRCLNEVPFYRQPPPKSLGREWVETIFTRELQASKISVEDKLRTVYEHIAIQVSAHLKKGKVLVTGGGTFNHFLMQLIKNYANAEIIIPSEEIVNYKEALTFAFLGLLRVNERINCFGSVTGAVKDSSSGVIFRI